jgi:pullulanase
LHPVHADVNAADKRIAAMAKFDTARGSFSVPARSAVVFVQK